MAGCLSGSAPHHVLEAKGRLANVEHLDGQDRVQFAQQHAIRVGHLLCALSIERLSW